MMYHDRERDLCVHGNFRDTCAFRPGPDSCRVVATHKCDSDRRQEHDVIMREIGVPNSNGGQEHDCIMREILGHD